MKVNELYSVNDIQFVTRLHKEEKKTATQGRRYEMHIGKSVLF